MKLFRYTILMVMLTAFVSCAKKEETTTTTTEDNGAITTDSMGHTGTDTGASGTVGGNNSGNTGTTQQFSDSLVLAKMAFTDSVEIAAAKMAQSKGKSAEVKAFAKQMITDHTKMKNDGAALAKKKNWSTVLPPGDPSASAVNQMMTDLSGKSGGAFDSLYASMMVESHGKALSELQEANGKVQDPDLKTAIGNAIPIVEKHKNHAESLNNKILGKK
jgi:putative membrane protein